MVPPRTGPNELPRYTPAKLIPIALPRSFGGNIEMRIAIEVPKIIALPSPCMARAMIRNVPEFARQQRSVARVKIDAPCIKIFFLPKMSASLPKGTRKTVVERRYVVAIQLNETMVMPNSFPIKGSDKFIAPPIKGVRKPQRPNMNNSLIL
jgi:hypothetical protein